MQPQLESPARTGADGSTADLRGRGKPAQPNTRANAGRALPLRAPAPVLRFGLQVERTRCGRVARGCARLRGASGTALSPYLNSVRCSTVNSARCVLGAAPARVAACRAQRSEPSREDGAGHALPGEGFPPAQVPGRFLHAPPCPALPGQSTRRAGCWELRFCRCARGSLPYHPGSTGLAPAAGAQVGTPILELQAWSYGTPGGGARAGGQRAISPQPPSLPELAPEVRKIKQKAIKKRKEKKSGALCA